MRKWISQVDACSWAQAGMSHKQFRIVLRTSCVKLWMKFNCARFGSGNSLENIRALTRYCNLYWDLRVCQHGRIFAVYATVPCSAPVWHVRLSGIFDCRSEYPPPNRAHCPSVYFPFCPPIFLEKCSRDRLGGSFSVESHYPKQCNAQVSTVSFAHIWTRVAGSTYILRMKSRLKVADKMIQTH